VATRASSDTAGTPAGSRERGRARSESGFALVEVLVSILVLTVGIVGLIGTLESSRHLGTNAEAHQTAVAAAEQELERIRSLPWERVALYKEEPTQTSTTNTNDPTYFEKAKTATCEGKAKEETECYEWNWESGGASEPLVTQTTYTTEPANPKTLETTATATGGATRLTFHIYRFITWVYDKACTEHATKCASPDAKRVLIAVTGSNIKVPVTLVTILNPVPSGPEDPIKGAECESSGGEKGKCEVQ